MHRWSKDEIKQLSQRNYQLLEFARTLEDKVTKLCQQPNNVCSRILAAIVFLEQT